MGLAKDRRLREPLLFKRLFKRGFLLKTKIYGIRALPNDLGYGRLAVLVSKKSLKRAVDRHCLKRLCQEAFRHSSAFFSPQDYLISLNKQGVKPRERRFLFHRLKEDFKSLAKA
ncbi:MAG: ribonuclease P protein component [Deltaproteobacteria bacterium]|nr:ribonuclease P protein component [Deltaproteobacteria bacterium]